MSNVSRNLPGGLVWQFIESYLRFEAGSSMSSSHLNVRSESACFEMTQRPSLVCLKLGIVRTGVLCKRIQRLSEPLA